MNHDLNRLADWQWNLNAWSKQDNPAAAVDHHLAYHLAGVPDHDRRALAWLCYGQRHDPQAVEAYRRHHDEHGAEALFTAVLLAHGDTVPDLAEAAVHLEWQVHSNPLSLVRAARAWESGTHPEAMFAVLTGQSHNGRACQLYRACFAHHRDELFAQVVVHARTFAAGGHEHPYLSGETPDAHVLRDAVPGSRAKAADA